MHINLLCSYTVPLLTAPLAKALSMSLYTAGRIQALAYGVIPYEQLQTQYPYYVET
jgi:hypothetical protein